MLQCHPNPFCITLFERNATDLRYGDLSAAQKRKLHLQLYRQMTTFENWFLEQVKESEVDVSEDVEWV